MKIINTGSLGNISNLSVNYLRSKQTSRLLNSGNLLINLPKLSANSFYNFHKFVGLKINL